MLHFVLIGLQSASALTGHYDLRVKKMTASIAGKTRKTPATWTRFLDLHREVN
jgi:hypothetical protein